MIRTKNDIIKKLMERHGLDSVHARHVIGDVLDGIVEAALEHGRIEIRRFGTFKVSFRAARVARNPRTNEPLKLPPRHVMTFEPSDKVSEQIAERYHEEHQQPGKGEYNFASAAPAGGKAVKRAR